MDASALQVTGDNDTASINDSALIRSAGSQSRTRGAWRRRATHKARASSCSTSGCSRGKGTVFVNWATRNRSLVQRSLNASSDPSAEDRARARRSAGAFLRWRRTVRMTASTSSDTHLPPKQFGSDSSREPADRHGKIRFAPKPARQPRKGKGDRVHDVVSSAYSSLIRGPFQRMEADKAILCSLAAVHGSS